MKVLVSGNKGYIGSVLTPLLTERRYEVRGYDVGYYEDCMLHAVSEKYPQIRKDIRDIEKGDVEGVDAVVHLAALSNDPLGDLAPNLTEEINLLGTIRLAELAKSVGVRRFVYSSSQSMYGISSSEVEIGEDESEKNGLTAYARTKWEAECELNRMSSPDFQVVSFRPSTVFGASPMLRCDIVYNNLVACAYTTGQIEIKSDGSPWRPVVHVRDLCLAFTAGLEASSEQVSGRAFNVGISDGNYTVRDLAEAAQRSVQGSTLVFTREHGSDSRTYRVDFRRILNELREHYKPKWNLEKGGAELVEFFDKVGLAENQFRGPVCNRLKQIKNLISKGKLNDKLQMQ